MRSIIITVLGQSPRLSAYYDRRNRFMTNLRKRKKYMFHFDDQREREREREILHKSMSPNVRIESATVRMGAQSSARPTEIPRSVRESEREREREREREISFVIRVDPSRAFTLR